MTSSCIWLYEGSIYKYSRLSFCWWLCLSIDHRKQIILPFKDCQYCHKYFYKQLWKFSSLPSWEFLLWTILAFLTDSFHFEKNNHHNNNNNACRSFHLWVIRWCIMNNSLYFNLFEVYFTSSLLFTWIMGKVRKEFLGCYFPSTICNF